MRTPLILFFLSLAGAGGVNLLSGPELTLPFALSCLSAIAALILVLMARRRARREAPKRSASTVRKASRPKRPLVQRLRAKGPHVILDGSNVMHWNGQEPHIDTLRDVIASLQAQGYRPGVIFDANAGYKFGSRYLDDRHFAKLLRLDPDRVLVVPKGEPADPTILAAARELKAKVVTNDRFADWAGDYPEVASSGLLVKGGYREGKLWLDEWALGQAA